MAQKFVLLSSMNIGNSGGLNVNTRNAINIISMTTTDIIVAHLLGSEYLRKWDETLSFIDSVLYLGQYDLNPENKFLPLLLPILQSSLESDSSLPLNHSFLGAP